MARFRLIDRLRYRLDATLSRGPSALIIWLFVIGGLLALLSATVITLSHSAPIGPGGMRPGFALLTWQGWQRTLNLTVGVGPLLYVIGTFIPTLGSLFIGGIFIGLLTGGIQNRIRNLRKGRSLVVEQGHTIILGWSQHIFQLVSELVEANQNKEDACIVVLAERDKVEMEDLIRDKVKNLGHTRVVCRTGSPIDLTDLALVNPDDARVIVILAPDTKDPDPQVIKTLLALTREQEQAHVTRRCPIVAEIRSPRNKQVAELIGKHSARVLQVDDMIARITVQTCRQIGLSAVYAELLGFDGDEMYMRSEPQLVGKTFGEALLAFEDSALVGLQRDGKSLFNPAMDTPITAEDRLIAVSRDDDTIQLSGKTLAEVEIDESALCAAQPEERTSERTLILGWNRKAVLIIRELDQYMLAGSVLTVVAEQPDIGNQIEKQRSQLKNLSVSFRAGDTTDRGALESLEVHGYHHVIVLGNNEKLSAQEADAATLITLLHLRDIGEKHGNPFTIVSEMFDTRNRELAEVTRADDVIVGDKLVSQLLAQMAESPDLLLDDLFNADGSELYLKPIDHYVRPGVPVNFYTVVEAARRRGEVALGYRLLSADEQKITQGVRINPRKSTKVTFSAQDKVVLLAQI